MEQNTLENLYSLKQFTEKFPFMTMSGLRYVIFNAEKNGFDKVIRRIGSKVLINAEKFAQWLEENNGRNIVTGQFKRERG